MFRPLRLEDKNLFDKYKSKGLAHSQYNFTNLFMWLHEYNPEIAEIAGCVCVVLKIAGRRLSLFPVGEGDSGTAVDSIISHYGNITFTALDDEKFEFINNHFNGIMKCIDVRKNYDYVYTSDKLINLRGKKMHSKRNHLKRFVNSYNYSYKKIDNTNLADCELIEKAWLAEKGFSAKTASSEYKSTMRILNNFDFLGCEGGIIYIDNAPAAYAIGEKVNDEVAIIHIEKAIGSYSGIYSAINQMCAKNAFSDVLYINREEDMGLESLIKAKLSYYPDKMIQYKRARFV